MAYLERVVLLAVIISPLQAVLVLLCLQVREAVKNYSADFSAKGGGTPHSAKLFWAE